MNRYKDWFEQGERDFERAKLDLMYSYYEWACFTSQQAAEKVVKALGMKLGVDLWGHSILNMLNSLQKIKNLEIPEDILECAIVLDKFYIPTRYPNGFPMGKPADYYIKKNAEEAIDAADNIIRFCKSILNR